MATDYYTKFEEHLYAATRKVLDDLEYNSTPVIYANADVLEPSKTYCVLDVLGIEQQGFTDEASWMKLDQDNLDFVTHYKACVQFTIVGTSSRSVAPAFRHNLINNPVHIFTFLKQNLGFLSRSKLRKIPQKRETEWVDSFNFDVDMSFTLYTKQTHDWVEKIVVNDVIIPIYEE